VPMRQQRQGAKQAMTENRYASKAPPGVGLFSVLSGGNTVL